MLVFLSCSAQKKYSNSTGRTDYVKRLNDALKIIDLNNSIEDSALLWIIPLSQTEFSDYYKYTYPENKLLQNAFYKTDSLITSKIKRNDSAFYFKYLNMAKFVDGEYAENYYDWVEYLLETDQDDVCNVINRNKLWEAKRLRELLRDKCK